jgi:hypothetical protein
LTVASKTWAFAASSSTYRIASDIASYRSRKLRRKLDLERRAPGRRRGQSDLAAELAHDLARQMKPKPAPVAWRPSRKEGIEDALG